MNKTKNLWKITEAEPEPLDRIASALERIAKVKVNVRYFT